MAKPVLACHMLRRALWHLDCCLLAAYKNIPDASSSRRLVQNRIDHTLGVLQERSKAEIVVPIRGSSQIWGQGHESGSLLFLGALGTGRSQLGCRTGCDLFPPGVNRGFSSGSKVPDKGSETDAAASASGTTDMNWIDTLKDSAERPSEKTLEIGAQVWRVSKEATENLGPVISQYLESSSPYVVDNIAPAASLLTCTFAWMMLPRVLRRMHKYSEGQGAAARLLGRTSQGVPYELCVWGALEGPARMYLTIITVSYMAAIVAPTSIAAEHVYQISRGATVVAVVWFLYNWKRNFLKRLMASPSVSKDEKEQYEALDSLASVGLLLLGGMALAEACGVAVQSVLTVGGIGGVATAFAAKDLLGNLLSGSALRFGKPFSVGDTIRAGTIEGKVVEMGMHSTQLLTADKSVMIVPNSMFSSQVIVNSSRAEFRGFSTKFLVHLQDFDKVPKVTEDIKFMLRGHPKVYLGEEDPRCSVSSVVGNALELIISCNFKHMQKDEFVRVQQEIILKAVKIINDTGAHIGAAS